MRIIFTKIEILEVKMGFKSLKISIIFIYIYSIGDASNANGYIYINYPLPPMQMDINYPLNIGKISDGKITQGKFSVEKKPANTNPQIFYRMNLHQLMFNHTVVMAVNDGSSREN